MDFFFIFVVLEIFEIGVKELIKVGVEDAVITEDKVPSFSLDGVLFWVGEDGTKLLHTTKY